MTAASAMAAAAMGFDGTGWDEYLTEHILGVDPNGARSSALSTLAGKHDEMHAVAEKLEEHGTIGQTEVNTAFQEVHERRQGIWDVALHVEDSDGKKQVHEVKSLNDHVMIPGEVYTIGEEEKGPAAS
jgi:hypothetical protein